MSTAPRAAMPLDRPAAGPSIPHSATAQRWLVAGVCWLLAAVALSVDVPLARWWGRVDLPGDLRGVLAIGERFGHGIGAIFVLLTVYVLESNRRVVLRMSLCTLAPGLVAQLVKSLVVRSRPITMELTADATTGFLAWSDAAALPSHYAGQSFPSGHTATAVGLAIALAWRYPRGRWLFYTLAALAAVQRMQCQAHFPSDVLVGAGLAVVVAGALTGGRQGRLDAFESVAAVDAEAG